MKMVKYYQLLLCLF